MTFRYDPLREDYLRLNRIQFKRLTRRTWIFSGLCLLGFLSLPLFLHVSEPARFSLLGTYWTAVPLLLCPAVVAVGYALTEWGARKRWNTVAEIRTPREYAIDEHGLRVTGDTFSGSVTWEYFERAEERDGLFLLATAQNQFYFFPVSLVPNIARLRALAAEKVRSGAKKKRLFPRAVVFICLTLLALAVAALYLPGK